MRGCIISVNTAEIIGNVAPVVASASHAYHMVGKQVIKSSGQEAPIDIPPVPPSYFKIGELVNVDNNKKVVCIAVSNRFLVPNVGDGVLVNTEATPVLKDSFLNLLHLISTG